MVAAILRRNLGEKKSFELLTQGFEFSAAEAFDLGLVNRVLDDEDFENAVTDYASVYSKVSKSGAQLTKTLLYDIDNADFNTALEKGAETNARARMTDDCKKGIAKFLEK
jgi:methylglutaconyl-CoA hydratase